MALVKLLCRHLFPRLTFQPFWKIEITKLTDHMRLCTYKKYAVATSHRRESYISATIMIVSLSFQWFTSTLETRNIVKRTANITFNLIEYG